MTIFAFVSVVQVGRVAMTPVTSGVGERLFAEGRPVKRNRKSKPERLYSSGTVAKNFLNSSHHRMTLW